MSRCPIEHPTCHRETESHCPTRNEKGILECTLGDTSIPVPCGNSFIVYEIKPIADNPGTVSVRLSMTHRSYIRYLAERGGEVPFDYGIVSSEVKRHLKDLVEMGILSETPIVGSDGRRVIQRLSDMGRNVATVIIKSQG